jgi:hypothetical protein
MKYAVEMGSGAMIYIPGSIKIFSDVQTFMGEIHRQHYDRVCLHLFFQNKKIML